jgi:hypothetical protein
MAGLPSGLRPPARRTHLAAGTTGQYAELRHRLNDYADRMAARIDENQPDLVS